MKKVRIVSIILILIVLIICGIQTTTYATQRITTGYYEPGPITGATETFKIATIIISVIRAIGIIVSVIGIMIIGIKYMMGSAEQKANYKKTMIPYIAGCVMIFAITGLLSLIETLVEGIK